MKKAFIFPGQASQYVGMGKDLYDQFSIAKTYFDRANEIMKIDLKEICFEGPEEELKKTCVTQPALFVHSVIVAEILKEKGFKPQGIAGHSLGEYSALAAVDAISFEAGLELVKKRSELMYNAGIEKPGTMAAIIGLETEQVNELCKSATDSGIIQPANYNSPGQIVVSGDIAAVKKVIELAEKAGAMKAVELVVSGAFHSPLMEDARQGLKEALEKTSINDTEVPLYSNVEAVAIQDKNKIRDLLFRQLVSPVRWQESMENMIKDGYDQFYEIGPGRVLKGLLKRISRQTPCREIGTADDIRNLENMV
ncbi:MAG: ACP S-malonyltransferase [Calditrichaceae bacterium]|nr:ACP S-malonyltransferase [Calditrichaceae bacterium]MBN2707663.1 ACP S-malonyltransferase [Calditrichaceae bacterium]RQV93168.1 MAG: [acyl-carrier-protein] S-malonyltransferase [Calditrichota bacterium]